MSEIWKSKMKRLFSFIDFDKDGIVSKKGWDLMVEGLCASQKDDPVKQDKVRRSYDGVWLRYTGSTKTNEKVLLTEAVLIDSLRKHRSDPKLKADFQVTCEGYFNAVDTSKDGYIQFQEYRRGLENGGVTDTSFAEQTFKVIDSDGDGKISLDELTQAYLEFMVSDDKDSPYNMYFGELK